MLPSNAPRPARRFRRGAVAAALAVIGLVPVLGSSPAAATLPPTPAPLTTVDGLGVRVDEAVFVGPALEDVETALQPIVDAALYDRAVELALPSTTSIDVSSDVELSVDLVDAGTSGYPDGGVELQADIQDVELLYAVDGGTERCEIQVSADVAVANAAAAIDHGLLPDAPLLFEVAPGEWDDKIDVATTPACWPLVPDGWFDDLLPSRGVVEIIQSDVAAAAQDLADGIWDDHVMPVLDGLPGGFGLTFNQIRTDDHGLVVTVNTHASGGISIPGFGGPYSVVNALDAGVTSDVDDLLGTREDGAIVTIHPNVANQYLYALTRAMSGQLTWPMPVSAAIEDLLLKQGVHGNYDDGGWTVSLSAAGSTTAPSAHPTGPDGAPELRFDPIDLTVHNTSYTTGPVAIFRGSITDTFDPGTATVNLTLLFGNPDVVTWNPDPVVMTPYARDAVAAHATLFAGYPSLGPTVLGGLTWCPTCTRYAGDERYTATLLL
jgi:hypothetical protein